MTPISKPPTTPIPYNPVADTLSWDGTTEEALKQSGPRVVLLVTHEPQPPGMRIIEVSRKDGQSLGISIHGGVGKPAANPADERDEGIFVEKVEPSSVCHRAGLQVGHRLIEVNGDSLLGCDQSEAAALLRASNDLRILVCDGYNVPHIPRIDDRGITSTKPVRVPPAVAPKPTLRNSQLQNVPPLVETANPEKLTFASKLKNFEREIEVQKLGTKQASASNLPLPGKKILYSDLVANT
ncbi:PDZ/DHR/GLGF domain protein [Teladorsagia circumcincta]|uniref:PDZ/DHR/GLGF domain protein n=1 Tax=Teladorsagia circumcincta TaxID=45464 RepID=A0A2G9V496_TELCI|nr:PDZ/DHR/GLGF domain protein [Teladorsagia circumcincta]